MRTHPIHIRNANGIIRGFLHQPIHMTKGCIICLHGGPNGDFHGNTNVFDQLAEIVTALGFGIIQFSFFGALPSDGEPKQICLRTQLTDYRSVLEHVANHYKCPVHIVGESAGATIAALEWQAEVSSYVLLWPALDLRDTDLRGYLNLHWWEKVKQDGYLNDNGLVIGSELFSELLLTNFEPSFRIPATPTLIVHGRKDNEVPISQSIRALELSTGSVMLAAIENGDHGCKGTSERKALLQILSQWFAQR